MDINFLPGTKIAYIDNLVPESICDSLFELVKWIDSKNVEYTPLSPTSSDDHILLDEHVTKEEHDSYWLRKNIYTEDLPDTYLDITFKISNAANEAMKLYLELLHGERKLFRRIAFDVIHIWRKDDSLDEHMDCFDFGLVYYLNSPNNWDGGTLYFPELDITLTPVKNRLLIIPSDIPHLVTPITAGIRANMTHFVPLDSD